jgi:hypothetical protein
MRSHTELVEEAIVSTLSIGTATLRDRRLCRTLDGRTENAKRSCKGNEYGSKGDHNGRLRLRVKLCVSARTIRRNVLGES